MFILCGCFQRIIVKWEELGIIFLELGFGPNEYFIKFYIGIKIPVVLCNRILKKCTGIRPLGFCCFFITEGAVFISHRLLQVILCSCLTGTGQGKEKRKEYN